MILSIISLIISSVTVAMLVVVLTKLNKSNGIEAALRKENERLTDLILQQNSQMRSEIGESVKSTLDIFGTQVGNQIKTLMDAEAEANRSQNDRLFQMQRTMENNLRSIQEDNTKQLEKMRETVDEKLSSTLEKRLNESFESVSKQLESVYKGLGEMQTLASSVGDLKSALTNVKVRGTWGEVALDSLLSQILSPEQYMRNVKPIPRSNNIVEFCICLPNNENSGIVYLPIDCKFPIENYIRLCETSEKGDAAETESVGKQLEASIKSCARDIRDKYISPPYTTDFAIMYLPIEGLYAEVARRTGLCETLQREYRVTVAGPTTIGAFLNSLQLGFKTLAIQKRTSEIASLLMKIKKGFGKFSELLEKTSKKLGEAQGTVDDLSKRYSSIGNLLNKADAFAPDELSGGNPNDEAT